MERARGWLFMAALVSGLLAPPGPLEHPGAALGHSEHTQSVVVLKNALTQRAPSARTRCEGPRARNRVRFFHARARLMLGVAVLIARPGMRREVALYDVEKKSDEHYAEKTPTKPVWREPTYLPPK